jgi:hypothetical protein
MSRGLPVAQGTLLKETKEKLHKDWGQGPGSHTKQLLEIL